LAFCVGLPGWMCSSCSIYAGKGFPWITDQEIVAVIISLVLAIIVGCWIWYIP